MVLRPFKQTNFLFDTENCKIVFHTSITFIGGIRHEAIYLVTLQSNLSFFNCLFSFIFSLSPSHSSSSSFSSSFFLILGWGFLQSCPDGQTNYWEDLSFNFLAPEFTFNSNKLPTWCNNFSVYYPDVCLQLNKFREFPPSSGAQWLQWQPLVLPSYRGDSHAVFVVGPAARILMMGGKSPETCWAVNKRQDNKLKNCWTRLVIYLNCTMMHGLTILKFYI
jgi:hypothetical protein